MIEWLIQSWGYPALFVGTFFEGETVLIVAGYAAHRGYLSLTFVLLIAFAGALAGDQLWFFLGRTHGAKLLAHRPAWQPRIARIHDLVQRHQTAVLLGFRFLYGVRNLTPFVLGASGFSPARFALLNAIGAAIWAIVVGVAGYLLGHGAELILADVKRFEIWIVAGAFLLTACIWATFQIRGRLRNRMRAAQNPPSDEDRPIA